VVFDDVLGQSAAVQILRRALATKRVHHAYRFEGPVGVGKQLTAFALAQSLVCTEGQDEGCGGCSACRRAVTLSDEEPHLPQHPDVVLVGRGLYPKALIGTKETATISVDQIRRVVLSRCGYSPHEARSLVFIIRDADELNLSSANALLKTLEEPRDDVHFILLTSRPHRLLDTIRSRTLPVRFGPLPEAVLAEILDRRGLSTEWLPLAQGSASAALELADEERRSEMDGFVTEFEQALASPDLRATLQLASKLPSDRNELKRLLLAFAQRLAAASRDLDQTQGGLAQANAQQYLALQRTVDALERNVSNALAIESLLVELRALRAA
jgi:DNA polymerase-3 subunit delta'